MEKRKPLATSVVVMGGLKPSDSHGANGFRSKPVSRKSSDSDVPRMDKSADSSPHLASRPIKPKSKTEVPPKKFDRKIPMWTTPKMKAKKHKDPIPELEGFKLGGNDEEKKTESEEFVRQAEIKRFAGRTVIKKYAYRSQKGIAPENPDKINQDSLFFVSNFAHFKEYFFMGVCDGHGYNGHHVSAKVKTRLPLHLASDKNLHTKPKLALKISTRKTAAEVNDSNFETDLSGTTLVSVLIMKKRLYCANVGDSRAILAIQDENQSLIAKAISRDHKPTESDERTRIIQTGGRIHQFADETGELMGPMRVWLKYEDTPGLAMSRSIGDTIAIEAGVISEPEVMDFDITDKTKIMIIASDGIWEFIDDQEAINMITPYFKKDDAVGAVDYLIHIATKRWQEEEGGTDDITCQVFFL